MSGRYTKSIPEHIYFCGSGEWIEGPYVHPKRGNNNRKFKLVEVLMDKPKKKKSAKITSEVLIACNFKWNGAYSFWEASGSVPDLVELDEGIYETITCESQIEPVILRTIDELNAMIIKTKQ